jgi:ATP-dependent 26S proteasome regulatory subunit
MKSTILEGSSSHNLSLALDLSLQHLQAELARIDILISREVRRWQLAGQDPGDAFRGLYISDVEVNALLMRPLGTTWGQTVRLPEGEEQAFAEAQIQAERTATEVLEKAHGQGIIPHLESLASTFGLERFDLDVLLICLAPALDLRYERLYGYLQDDVTRKRPGVHLVLNLLGEPGPSRLLSLSHFAEGAPLIKHQIVECGADPGLWKPPLLSQTLSLDETVAKWLLGSYQPHLEHLPYLSLIYPDQGLIEWCADREIIPQIEGSLEQNPVIVFYGPDQASQEAAAQSIAGHLERPLLKVDLISAIKGEITPSSILRLALRDACLTGALPFLSGWDACLEDGSPPASLLAELISFPGSVILSGLAAWQPRAVERQRNLLWLEFGIPDYQQRCDLWRHFLGQEAAVQELDISPLAGQFLLTTGQIRDAVATAKDLSLQRGSPLRQSDIFAAARMHSNPRLSALAHKIVPRYGWEDIVLPEDQLALLHEIIATVRGRPLVLEEWGLGQKLVSSKGVTILFSGPPGTGKTMAAEVIASELGLDLFKIDLSTIVSKYIGETEKNLERIFNEAETSNAILFFDEADALFGKRSEVRDSHDRYANIEISYLLQRMEAYNGVTILATNMRANLDEAFTRRLQFAVDFPFPDEAYRLRIWHALFPVGIPRTADIDFAWLAHRFKLAGGNIRNIIVGAAYLASSDGGCVTMNHMLHGARRELQKMGRLVEEDLTIR